jgi:hypothetical protein
MCPCRRFALPLAEQNARLGGDVTRYVFIVEDLHLLLLAGLPAHCQAPEILTHAQSRFPMEVMTSGVAIKKLHA